MKGGGKIEPPKATAALLSRLGWEDREIHAESFLDWLREAARPPPGVELVSADGSLFTGIVIVDRNRPVLMLAARQACAPRPRPPDPPPYPGSPHTTLQRRLFDEEEEARRGETPEWWRR
jgi:hypothetical protein